MRSRTHQLLTPIERAASSVESHVPELAVRSVVMSASTACLTARQASALVAIAHQHLRAGRGRDMDSCMQFTAGGFPGEREGSGWGRGRDAEPAVAHEPREVGPTC